MVKKLFISCLLFLFLIFPVVSQLPEISMTIQSTLQELRIHCQNLNTELTELKQKQVVSQTELINLQNSLDCTMKQSEDYYKKLIITETQLKAEKKTLQKLIKINILFLIIFILIRILSIILKYKYHIKLPDILNILL